MDMKKVQACDARHVLMDCLYLGSIHRLDRSAQHYAITLLDALCSALQG